MSATPRSRTVILFLLILTPLFLMAAFLPTTAFQQDDPEDPGAEEEAETIEIVYELMPLENIVDVDAGPSHTCALTSNGGVKCWGDNSFGRLGDGTNETRDTPTDVIGLSSGVKAIAAGGDFTCALTNSGNVKCWGYNASGQLGDGSTEDRWTPVDVVGLTSGVVAIAAGERHACALTESGQVKCWGDNNWGKVNAVEGEHDQDILSPVDVVGLTNDITAIDLGYRHSCAITEGGGVKCWGDPGLPGEGVIDVPGLTGEVIATANGVTHACALNAEGKVFCMGFNEAGQLGDGTTETRTEPVEIIEVPDGVTTITAGLEHTCVIANGQAWCWGDNSYGQLGDGTVSSHYVPTLAEAVEEELVDISAGYYHTCAVTQQGRVLCWGDHREGRLGDGALLEEHTPIQVTGLDQGLKAIDAGETHTCAITLNDRLLCWGSNDSGELGEGSEALRGFPVEVQGLPEGVTSVAVGGDYTCALTTAGGVKCWGRNIWGELGDGTNDTSLVPVDVLGLTSNVTAIAAAEYHACALTTSGGVKCWGYNDYGRLGSETEEDFSLVPLDVGGLTSGVSAIALGYDFSCALLENGNVKCWGDRFDLQAGSTESFTFSPYDINGLPNNLIAINAGNYHACAWTEDGLAYCWGSSGLPNSDLAPIDLDEKVTAVAGGQYFTCILTASGAVQCLGENYVGQLGDGTTLEREIWEDVEGLNRGVTAIAAGDYHACAVTDDGGAVCWGNNAYGQLGDGSLPRLRPVEAMALQEAPLEAFREPGLLVPELTTYIPTPLDISTEPKVLGTNLLLAAIAMLPFAIATELLSRTLSEYEASLTGRLKQPKFLNVLQQRINTILGTRLSQRRIMDIAKLIAILVFYGLVFSLLDPSWRPLTITGLVLFLEMTLAYGIVGLAGDLTQWRTARRWQLPAELNLRPTNVLLAMGSTLTSRLMKLVPGLMFGTPEALDLDEDLLDPPKKDRLLRIATFTLIGVGFGIWILSALTAWLQRLDLSQGLSQAIGGLEGFLLVVFAVALENLFIQMLGLPNTFGQKFKKRNRWAWLAGLVAVTFAFYHTLINPKGELATAMQEGNVLLFLIVVGIFVVFSFGLWLTFKWRERRRKIPAQPIRPTTIQEPFPTHAVAAPVAPPVIREASKEKQPTCAECGHSFAWAESFRQTNTPGSDSHNPPGMSCWRPRTFCPHCGTLVAEWHITPQKDFNKWIWFGEQAKSNQDVSLPPSPNLYGGGINIPLQYTAYIDEHRVDVAKIKEDLARQKEIPKKDEPQPWEPAYKEASTRYQSGDIAGALQSYEQAIDLGLPAKEQAIIHGAIGEHFLLKERDIETAQNHLQRSVELDPSGFWSAHFYLSLIYAKHGEASQADQAYRNARRFAQTVWFTPKAEGEARRIIEDWIPDAEPSPEPVMPEEAPVVEAEEIVEEVAPSAESLPPPATPEEMPTTEAEGIADSKTCPMCAEEIKLEARICRYCRTRFEIQIQGYCSNCQALVGVNEADRCAQCGGEVTDRQIQSRWLGEDSGTFIPSIQVPSMPATSPSIVPATIVSTPPEAVPIPAVKKRNWWILPVALVAIGGLAAGGYFLFGPPSQRQDTKGTPTNSVSVAGLTQTAALSHTPTKAIMPTQTPEPTPIPEWVQGFVETVIYYINNAPPDFEDDFFTQKEEWGNLDQGVSITEGVLRMDLTETDGWAGDPLQGEDVAIQFEFTPIVTYEGAMVYLFLRQTEDGNCYQVGFQMEDGSWQIRKHSGETGNVTVIAEGQSESIAIGEATNVLIIAQGEQISVFLNDQPLAYIQDNEFCGDWNPIGVDSLSGHSIVEFDNLRFWRLTSFEAFADPILDTLVDIPAHLTSDFSSPAGGVYTWNCTDIIKCEIVDGVMRLNVDRNEGINLFGEPLNVADFVLEVEINPEDIAGDSGLIFAFHGSDTGFYSFNIGFTTGNWDINRFWFHENGVERLMEGTTNPIYQGSWARFRFIARNDQFAVYLDDAPLICFRDSTFDGNRNEFQPYSNQGLLVLKFDNAKLWDLSKVGNLP
jgi:alpha-tubulin suppressor-like RCC1 family protein